MRIGVMMLYLRKKVMIMPAAGWDFAQLWILFFWAGTLDPLGFPCNPIIGTYGLTLSKGPKCHVEP